MEDGVLTERETQLTTTSPDSGQLVSADEMSAQIRAAGAAPRDIRKALGEAVALASDPAICETMWYALERRDRHGRKSTIVGPSIRLAEIVAYCWRNVRYSGRVERVEATQVIAEGVAFDLERNVAARVSVNRSIIGASGRYHEDMIAVTANAATSIAMRNALFRVVPGAFTRRVLDAAREAARGAASPVTQAARAMAFLKTQGVLEEHVLAKLGRKSMSSVDHEDVERIRGWANMIRDEEAKPETLFARGAPVEEAEVLTRPKPSPSPPTNSSADDEREPARARKAPKSGVIADVEAVSRAQILAGRDLYQRASPHATKAATNEEGVVDWQAFLSIFQVQTSILEAACCDSDPVGAMRLIANAQAAAAKAKARRGTGGAS